MIATDFINRVNTLSEQTIQLCYHCHKCTAGCPVAGEMTYGPDRILRLVQLGQKERLLASPDIWLCASCETCGTRCPNEIDIGAGQMAVAEGVSVAEPEAVKFHRLFLFLLRHLGRMHEATLLALYKLWTRQVMADMDSGLKLLVKGKVPLLPHPIKARNKVKRIFKATLIDDELSEVRR